MMVDFERHGPLEEALSSVDIVATWSHFVSFAIVHDGSDAKVGHFQTLGLVTCLATWARARRGWKRQHCRRWAS